MAKRCIYFVKDNQLRVKTIDVAWDKDAVEVSTLNAIKALEESAEDFMRPCINVSTSSKEYNSRSLATCFIKDLHGKSVKDLWAKLDCNMNSKLIPPGCHDLVYLACLNEKQLTYALCQKSFYDVYHNPDKTHVSNARALAVLQLLYRQGKLDYIEEMNKFLWWYYANGSYAIEWVNK